MIFYLKQKTKNNFYCFTFNWFMLSLNFDNDECYESTFSSPIFMYVFFRGENGRGTKKRYIEELLFRTIHKSSSHPIFSIRRVRNHCCFEDWQTQDWFILERNHRNHTSAIHRFWCVIPQHSYLSPEKKSNFQPKQTKHAIR